MQILRVEDKTIEGERDPLSILLFFSVKMAKNVGQ